MAAFILRRGWEGLATILVVALIALLTVFIWRMNERLTWFTGALESHSDQMRQLEAARGVNGAAIPMA